MRYPATMLEEITFGGRLKKADMAAALRLHGGNALRRWQLGIYATLAMACLLIAVVTEWIFAVIALMFAAMFILTLYGPRIAAHQQWKGYQTVREEVSGSAGAERVVVEYPSARGEVEWTALYGYKMDQERVLLYQSKLLFNVVERRFFAGDDDWRSFRDLVRQKTEPYRPSAMRRLLPYVALWVTLFVATILLWSFLRPGIE